MSGELKEAFLYPRNKRLKGAYIGLLSMVCKEKRITFSANQCIQAICDHFGWIVEEDHTGGLKIAGPAKKAKELLRTLAGSNFVVNEGLLFTVCAYDAQSCTSVVSFHELFILSRHDKYMSEFIEPALTVTFKPWADSVTIQTKMTLEIDDEVTRVLSATPLINSDVIESSFSCNGTSLSHSRSPTLLNGY